MGNNGSYKAMRTEKEIMPFACQYLQDYFGGEAEFIDKEYDIFIHYLGLKIEVKTASFFISKGKYKCLGYFQFNHKDFIIDCNYHLFGINVFPFHNEYTNYIFCLIESSFVKKWLEEHKPKANKKGKFRKSISIQQVIEMKLLEREVLG